MTDLDLPPGFQAVTLREAKDAFAHAQAIAAADGAGTLAWVRRFDLVEIAIVLEPDEPLRTARRALYAVMTAVADALAAHAPPERSVAFDWPDTILLDGGVLGGVRLAWPAMAGEDEIADWLVAGVMVRTVVPVKPAAPPNTGGHALDTPFVRGTSLESEGFEMIDPAALISSLCRHLMVAVDLWQEKGFKAVGEQYLSRLAGERGVRRGLDGNGDLLIQHPGALKDVERTPLMPRLAAPQWLDAETGAPWL